MSTASFLAFLALGTVVWGGITIFEQHEEIGRLKAQRAEAPSYLLAREKEQAAHCERLVNACVREHEITRWMCEQ